MYYMMILLLLGFLAGIMVAASNPSPYFAALGLVTASGMGCGILAGYGGPFLSLVLFLIYLGGMMVVFAYCTALAADPHPETLGSQSTLKHMVGYTIIIVLGSRNYWGGWGEVWWPMMDEAANSAVERGDAVGAAMLYSTGGGVLFVAGWALFLTLFVVLRLTRGLSEGALRAV
uniref:NADH dehydrogenase subunit 6 n=1 Tax=Ophidion muraenolepis TaxID=2589338 RepID=UPI0028FCBC0D|nr:NADH dehydrogenase subunit 6 [Ophidion muraenolepis]WNH38093.1 NADH dehydrogenase subunit 6 [Ophidion muraenolepis]